MSTDVDNSPAVAHDEYAEAVAAEEVRHAERMRALITDYRMERHPLQETYDVGMDIARRAHQAATCEANLAFRERRDALAAALTKGIAPLDKDYSDAAASLLARHRQKLAEIQSQYGIQHSHLRSVST